MGKRKYPYQDLSMNNINGELWKDVPGFKQLYKISSFGRVKTLKRTYVNNIGATVPIRERILKTVLTCRKSKTVPHDSFSLTVGLCRDGQRYIFYIGRLVYYCFVEKFDLRDRSVLIGYKDWDGRNLRPDNLYRTSIRELMQVSHDQNRYTTLLSTQSKKVSQFDIDGNFITSYESIIEASQITGFAASNISQAANGTVNLCNGYKWQFGGRKDLDKKKQEKKDLEINELILQQAGITAVGSAIPPVADLRLKNLKGERWKDIAGFKDHYQVSNFGRVKSLKRLTTGDRQYLRPEFIKKASLKFNRKDKEQSKYMTPGISLYKDGRHTSYTIARLVYNHFVAAFDIYDLSRRIGYKDGNPMNIHYRNLVLK